MSNYFLLFQVTSAILNSLKFSPSSQPEDGPMGISVAISTNTGIAKSAITNASFRAKKLPGTSKITENSQRGVKIGLKHGNDNIKMFQ